MTQQKKQNEASKGEKFVDQIPTGIWLEESGDSSPYIPEKQYLYGFDFEEVIEKLTYPSLVYLMILGEPPCKEKEAILNLLMKVLVTTGPRHPACRAAMNAGIGRTDVTHILPIALNVNSGAYLGAKEVGNCVKWLAKHSQSDPAVLDVSLPRNDAPNPVPGFGLMYGCQDLMTKKWVSKFREYKESLPTLLWIEDFLQYLNANMQNPTSWLPTGLAATVLYDLGFSFRHASAMYQFLGSPGFIAHGVEKANKPLTDMPFIKESNYEIE